MLDENKVKHSFQTLEWDSLSAGETHAVFHFSIFVCVLQKSFDILKEYVMSLLLKNDSIIQNPCKSFMYIFAIVTGIKNVQELKNA